MDTSSPEFQEALRDHARTLGVDPEAESYLLPLVQEALLAELPPDWEQGETEDGTLYYFNSSTEESIWEHPLDAHYRELIHTKKEEQKEEQGAQPTETIPTESKSSTTTATRAATAATNNVDVYSFDDPSDEETTSPARIPTSSKSRISDLFATSTVSIPERKSGNTLHSSLDISSIVTERPQTTPTIATGFGFGRDRSWLLDNDNDMAPIAFKTTPALSTTLQKQDTTPVDAILTSGTSRLGSFSSRRSEPLTFSTTVSATPNIATDAVIPLNPLPGSHSTSQSADLNSKRPSSQDTQSATSSSTTIAKMHQLETKLAEANSSLARERAALADSTRQLQTAQQEAKESNYLKMKVNELKTKLSEQESAASIREKQQLDQLVEQESAASAREKQHAAKLSTLQAENARLIKQQGHTQSQQLETLQKETQQYREAMESKQAELEGLQTRLKQQQQQAKTVSDAYEQAKAQSQQKFDQQIASAEAAGHQYVVEIASLRDQLETLELQLRSLKSTAQEQTTKCAQLEKLQQELESLRTIANEHEKLQQELHTLKNTADQQIRHCEQQEKLTRDMEETNRGLQAQVARLERESTEMKRKHDALTQNLDAKKADNATLQTSLNRTQNELHKVQDEMRKAQDQLRTISSSLEQQKHQQQLALERERITANAEAQAQARVQRLQTQLNEQLDEQTTAKAKLQSEVNDLRSELASVQTQEVKPLEKFRDQLQREVDRLTERLTTLEKELRTARQELSGQTDRANQLEIEVDVLVRREQQRKSQTDALTSAKNTAEKQLTTLQDELLTVQHDKRIDVDKLSFRVRELECLVTQKEYEAVRLEERFTKAEAWRAKEAARVEKRDTQIMELREQLTTLQARHVEIESCNEIQELRASKQKTDLMIQKLERELNEERDARKRDEIRRTEELQRMQQAVEWQLPQLAQACVTRSSDEWARKCRDVAKKLREELNLRALQDRNELVAREHKAQEACDRAEQKLKTAIAESEFLRREVSRLEDNNKVLLEQLHTIRVYLTQRQMPSQVSSVGSSPWPWPGGSTQSAPIPAPSAPVPINFNDFSTVNQLNTQLGILHAQFQQLFDSNERRTTFSSSDRFEIPSSPTGSTSRASGASSKEEERRQAASKREQEDDAELQRLAVDALMDQKLAACHSSNVDHSGPLERQQEELLTTLESLGETPNASWLPLYSSGHSPLLSIDEDKGDNEPHSTLWYQQDYWRRKYQ